MWYVSGNTLHERNASFSNITELSHFTILYAITPEEQLCATVYVLLKLVETL